MSRASEPRIVVALDYARPLQALALADRLDASRCAVKVGHELFTRAGPEVLLKLHAAGFRSFLDLKFHDIPNTVAGACRAAAELGVWMLNVHAAGGRAMMEAAREALEAHAPRPLIVAVTVLTSLDDADLRAVGVEGGTADQVLRLARLADACGLDGAVCSPVEVATLRSQCRAGFRLVTPGIRPSGVEPGDQKRTMTPAEGARRGADHLVVGRAVTHARDPMAALDAIARDLP